MSDHESTERALATRTGTQGGPDATVVLSRDKYVFELEADRWRLSKDTNLNVGKVTARLAPELDKPYRAVMRYYAENKSPYSCLNMNERTYGYLVAMKAKDFDETTLRNYRGSLTRKTEWYLGVLRVFLTRWYNQGRDGVSDEAMDYLDSLTLRGNEKGKAVLSMDPDEGPLTDEELHAFNERAAQLFELGRIDITTLANALLLSHTGRRPGQATLLRAGDLFKGKSDNDEWAYLVNFSQTKLRATRPRTEFKAFLVTAELFRVLEAQRDAVIARVKLQLGTLEPELEAELPLFPNWRTLTEIRSHDELRLELETDTLHATTREARDRLNEINVRQPRTGRPLHLTPRRFRYTLATRAGRAGFGVMVIAELLGHSDTQNAKVYVRDHPSFRKHIDEAVGPQLTSLARAYSGRIVDNEKEGVNAGDPRKRVGSFHHKTGTCGSGGFCGAEAYACYTCIHFLPDLYAPHEKMLEWFQAENREAEAAGASEQFVHANDRNILAVMQVMAACEKLKREKAEASNE